MVYPPPALSAGLDSKWIEGEASSFVVPREARVDRALFSLTPVCFFCSLSLCRRQSRSVCMTSSTSFTFSSSVPHLRAYLSFSTSALSYTSPATNRLHLVSSHVRQRQIYSCIFTNQSAPNLALMFFAWSIVPAVVFNPEIKQHKSIEESWEEKKDGIKKRKA